MKVFKDENDYEMKCFFFSPQGAFTDYFALTGTLGMKQLFCAYSLFVFWITRHSHQASTYAAEELIFLMKAIDKAICGPRAECVKQNAKTNQAN